MISRIKYLLKRLIKKQIDFNKEIVIVHQMGKVGSSALDATLNAKGYESIQTHLLGQSNLIQMLKNMTGPQSDINRVFNESELFNRQVIATKLITEYQSEKYGDKKLKLISLVREPIDRWFSAFIQNYKFYLPMIEALSEGKDFSINEKINYMYEVALDILEKSPANLGTTAFAEWFSNTKFFDDPKKNFAIKNLMTELTIPFYWFEKNIQNVIGIDIFEKPITDNYNLYTTNHFKFILLKYEMFENEEENLKKILGEFLDIEEFNLLKVNVTSGKSGVNEAKEVFKQFSDEFKNLEVIKKSKYCLYFKY